MIHEAMHVHVYRGTCTYWYAYAGVQVLRYYWILLVPVYCSTGTHYVMIVSVHTMAGLAARRLRPFWRMLDASDVTR
eukprot:SAG11_NODE_27967_length_326_cov_5.149780_1_plen_76_part_10